MQSRVNDEADIAHFSSPDRTFRRPSRPLKSGIETPNIIKPGGGASSQPPKSVTISTSLPPLDAALAVPSRISQSPFKPSNLLRHRLSDVASIGSSPGGLRRGEVTEVTGPRDTAGPLNTNRFWDIYAKDDKSADKKGEPPLFDVKGSALDKVFHFHVSTLSHLLALISLSPNGFPPADTGLIVIDSISSLFRAEFRTKLRRPFSNQASSADLEVDQNPRFTAKFNVLNPYEEKLRWRIIGNILSSLNKLANIFNCAVIVMNEMATRFRPGQRPMIHEALTGTTWDIGIGTKIILYWTWSPKEANTSSCRAMRIAEVLKIGKVSTFGKRSEKIIPYIIQKTGLGLISTKLNYPASSDAFNSSQPFFGAGLKRKFDDGPAIYEASFGSQALKLITSQDLAFDIGTPENVNLIASDASAEGGIAPIANDLQREAIPSYLSSGNAINDSLVKDGTASVDENDLICIADHGPSDTPEEQENRQLIPERKEPVVYDSCDEEES
ncbi:hypothetical protein KEM54_003178 [Ascosphaera aggregata]|nr:hypothetical protein KEM54_003178 [Ascosphaera aggregata]